MTVCLDTGPLIALDRSDPYVLALLDGLRARDEQVLIPAGVLAQAWRSPRQARLGRLVRSTQTTVVPLDLPAARAIGVLLALSGHDDVVDAHVALVARQYDAAVVTSDPGDIARLDPGLAIYPV